MAKAGEALAKIFPQIKLDYPRDAAGKLVLKKLPDEELAKYRGVLGHFHIQTNKTDPGPALQWDKVIDGARKLLQQTIAAATTARAARPDKLSLTAEACCCDRGPSVSAQPPSPSFLSYLTIRPQHLSPIEMRAEKLRQMEAGHAGLSFQCGGHRL